MYRVHMENLDSRFVRTTCKSEDMSNCSRANQRSRLPIEISWTLGAGNSESRPRFESRPFVIADRFRTSWQSASSASMPFITGRPTRRRWKRDRATRKKKERERKSMWPPLYRGVSGDGETALRGAQIIGPQGRRGPQILSLSLSLSAILFPLSLPSFLDPLRFPPIFFIHNHRDDSLPYLVS